MNKTSFQHPPADTVEILHAVQSQLVGNPAPGTTAPHKQAVLGDVLRKDDATDSLRLLVEYATGETGTTDEAEAAREIADQVAVRY